MEAGKKIDADVCVIGSGFGGAMAAKPLVEAGYDVVMLERGDWVPRGEKAWGPEASLELGPFYNLETPYRVLEGGHTPEMGVYSCVGGPSVFYGGVSLRFRESDFEDNPGMTGESGASWPIRYSDLEPFYCQAEKILDVAGNGESDPTEPQRSQPYPQQAAPLSKISTAIANAGKSLGLSPFPLPLAFNHRAGKRKCQLCSTCDTFACAVSAKNDLATVLLPKLAKQGLRLRPSTIAVKMLRDGKQVSGVQCVDKKTGENFVVKAKWVVLAAGALASPHLALASGLDTVSPAEHAVGKYLMRHVNAIVFGLFPRMPGPVSAFHKQVGFHDFYFGDGSKKGPEGKLGCIQQLASPPLALVQSHLPGFLSPFVKPFVRRMTGLLVMAEDQPRPENGVSLGNSTTGFGLPQLEVRHRYTMRDLAARHQLRGHAKKILRRAGAWLSYTHKIQTFSHAVGTLRMGTSPETSPVDKDCRFRGVENLSVVDGSVMPTSAGLNPSLTISANALRAGTLLVESGAVR